MVQATIHFPSDQVTVEFESEYEFVKWLGYLKEHGLATVKLAGHAKSVIVFRVNISYIEADGDAQKLALV
jgi:hypothetical protein